MVELVDTAGSKLAAFGLVGSNPTLGIFRRISVERSWLDERISEEETRHWASLASIADKLLGAEVEPFCRSRGWGFSSINNDWWFTEKNAATHEQRFRKFGDLPDDVEFNRICVLLSTPAGYGQDIGCFLHCTRVEATE